MSGTSNDKPVRVTAEERVHPALTKLARAFIALARQQRRQSPEATPTTKASSPEQPGGGRG